MNRLTSLSVSRAGSALAGYAYAPGAAGNRESVTESSGRVVSYTYDAFGILTSRTGSTPNEYLYAGERRDPETGLDYLRARYLRPEAGRFQTADTYERGFR